MVICDMLNVCLQVMFDKLYDVELEFNLIIKSNNQIGFGVFFGLICYNVFGGGEMWNVKLKGFYEWQIGQNKGSLLMNSWEMGVFIVLIFFWVVFFFFGGCEYDFLVIIIFCLYIDQFNCVKYYKLLVFGGNVIYDFQLICISCYSLIFFWVIFNVL